MLVDRQGKVSWRESGVFTPEKGESLAAAIREGSREDEVE
jgi:hypothetical protein